MKAVFALYLAQAREFIRDRSSLFFVLLLPVAFGVFFGLIFSGGGGFTLELAVANEDPGPLGAELVRRLEDGEAAAGIRLHTGDREQLQEKLQKGEVHVLMILPADMSAALNSGQPVTVEVLYDPGRPSSTGIGLGMVRTLLNETNLALTGTPPQLAMEQQAIQSQSLRAIDFYMPGMLGVALLWLGVFGTAQPLVAQREAQVLRRFSVTPITRLTMLTAEVSWRVSVGLLQTAVFLLVGYFGFGVGVRDWLPFAGAALLGTLLFVTMVGASPTYPPLFAFAILAVWLIVFTILAIWFWRWE